MKHSSTLIKISGIFLLLFLSVTTFAQRVIEGTWTTQANQYNTKIGKRYTFIFPAGGMVSGRIWGTGIYTTDCSIASAAVHAGMISAENGGEVTIEIRPGQASYEGSISNGVSSFHWGSFASSFVFVNTRSFRETSTPLPEPSDWNTQASQYIYNVGKRYTYYFAPGGTVTGAVWGTGIYTTDCSIASAAVHAGLITPERGGTVTIEILPGQSSYKGTIRNGVSSNNWGTFPGSFKFVRRRNW